MKQRSGQIPPNRRTFLSGALDRLIRTNESAGDQEAAARWRAERERTRKE
jgi:hypothetical protein